MQFEKSEGQGQQVLYTGILEGAPVMVNPNKKALYEWRGWEEKEDSKEPEYVGKDRDENTRITVEFCIEDKLSGKKFQHRILVTDKKSVSEKSGKKQYVNQLGMSTWVDDKKNLPEWFLKIKDKNKEVIAETDWREAYQGEADIYEFMRNWLGKVNWFSPTTNVLLDMKKLFRGNVDEIRNLIPTDKTPEEEILAGTLTMLAVVYITEKDGEKKMYQNIAKVYMPGYRIKNARLACTTNSWDSDKNTKRFKEQVIASVKEAYKLDVLQEFDESQHLQATDQVISHSETPDDTSY